MWCIVTQMWCRLKEPKTDTSNNLDVTSAGKNCTTRPRWGVFYWWMRKGAQGQRKLKAVASSEKGGQSWDCMGQICGTHSRELALGQATQKNPLLTTEAHKVIPCTGGKKERFWERLNLAEFWSSEGPQELLAPDMRKKSCSADTDISDRMQRFVSKY